MSVLFDTNILLYADDADAGAKTNAARDLLRHAMSTRTGVVSTQVLQEFYVNARRKLHLDGAAARARTSRPAGASGPCGWSTPSRSRASRLVRHPPYPPSRTLSWKNDTASRNWSVDPCVSDPGPE